MAYYQQDHYFGQQQNMSGPTQQKPMQTFVNAPEPEEFVTLGRGQIQHNQEEFPQEFQESYQPQGFGQYDQYDQQYDQQYAGQYDGQYDQQFDQQYAPYDQQYDQYGQPMGYDQQQYDPYYEGYPEAPLPSFPTEDQATAVNAGNMGIDSKHKSFNLERDFAPERESGCMYGCIPVNKNYRMFCLLGVGLLLLVLGIIGFLFFPRMPTFKVMSINPQQGNGNFKLSDYNPDNPDAFSFTMKMDMALTVVNTNFYHLKVESIKLKTYIRANISEINNSEPSPGQAIFSSKGQKRIKVNNNNYQNPIGDGTYGELTMPRDKNVSFTMPLTIQYKPSSVGAVNDPSLNEMVQLCIYSDADSDRRTVIYYEATNDIAAVKWFGYNPMITGEIRIRCPFQGEQKEAFIRSLQGGSTTAAAGAAPTAAAAPAGQARLAAPTAAARSSR